MNEKSVIHITGASGSGVTTLGRELALKTRTTHLDTDDFYWTMTDPPYQHKKPIEDRRAQIISAIENARPQTCILSGSLDSWGGPLSNLFKLVYFFEIADGHTRRSTSKKRS